MEEHEEVKTIKPEIEKEIEGVSFKEKHLEAFKKSKIDENFGEPLHVTSKNVIECYDCL